MIISKYGAIAGKTDKARCINCHTKVILEDSDYDKSFNGAKQWTCPVCSTKNIVNKFTYKLPDPASINFDEVLHTRIRDILIGIIIGIVFTIVIMNAF